MHSGACRGNTQQPQGSHGVLYSIRACIEHVVSGQGSDMESGVLQSRQVFRVARRSRDVRGGFAPAPRMRNLDMSNQQIRFLQGVARKIEK